MPVSSGKLVVNLFQHDPARSVREAAKHWAVRAILRMEARAVDLSGKGAGAKNEITARVQGKDRDKQEDRSRHDAAHRLVPASSAAEIEKTPPVKIGRHHL